MQVKENNAGLKKKTTFAVSACFGTKYNFLRNIFDSKMTILFQGSGSFCKNIVSLWVKRKTMRPFCRRESSSALVCCCFQRLTLLPTKKKKNGKSFFFLQHLFKKQTKRLLGNNSVVFCYLLSFWKKKGLNWVDLVKKKLDLGKSFLGGQRFHQKSSFFCFLKLKLLVFRKSNTLNWSEVAFFFL